MLPAVLALFQEAPDGMWQRLADICTDAVQRATVTSDAGQTALRDQCNCVQPACKVPQICAHIDEVQRCHQWDTRSQPMHVMHDLGQAVLLRIACGRVVSQITASSTWGATFTNVYVATSVNAFGLVGSQSRRNHMCDLAQDVILASVPLTSSNNPFLSN